LWRSLWPQSLNGAAVKHRLELLDPGCVTTRVLGDKAMTHMYSLVQPYRNNKTNNLSIANIIVLVVDD